MDDLRRDQQKAKLLAFLLAFDIGHRCTPEDLSNACVVFPVTPAEIEGLCTLPDVPLCLLGDRHVEVTNGFDISFRTSYVQLLRSQKNPRAECHLSTQAPNFGSPNPPQQIEGTQPATHEGNPQKPQRTNEADLVGPHIENQSSILQRTEQSQPVPPVACLAEQGLVPLLKDINAQPKKKSRDPRSVPHFEDYFLDGEVGSGGYGTVYKVRRHTDEQVFAMKCMDLLAITLICQDEFMSHSTSLEKWQQLIVILVEMYHHKRTRWFSMFDLLYMIAGPLENTHDSCVRNEINMLKQLRGKDYIIQFQNEVMGKVSPKPETGGVDDIKCPSILLEFIEHDKPEVLKKEITIDELKFYSFSLFKALAELQKERILHLDIKPGNFLFSRKTKRGCLVDFNLARVESVKRLSTSKALERRKCPKRPLVHEDTTLTCVKVSKRRRELIEKFPEIEPLRANNVKCIRDQGKETLGPATPKDCPVAASPKCQQSPQSRPNSAMDAITGSIKHVEPLKVNNSFKNTGSVHQVEAPKIEQTLIHGPALAGNHRLYKIWKENADRKPSCLSTPPFMQSRGVSNLKPNPNKRVPAGVPPHPQAVVQSSTAKKGKPAPKLRAPVKDGPCVGTKGYRAPEVLMRSTRQTTKVDIWSAGVSLLQLVTGRSPFPSTTTEGALKDIAKMRGSVNVDRLAKSLGQRHRLSKDPYQGTTVKEWSEKHSRRTDLKGRVPSTLYDLIEKCLEVNPDSRISAEAALQHEFCFINADASEFSGHLNPS